MGRAKSAVWNEFLRNRVKGKYTAKKAQHKAYARRKYAKYQGKKIVHNPTLQKEIDLRLLDDQSPEAIAGYLGRHNKRKNDCASKNAIYRYLDSVYGRRIETQLWLKRKKRSYRKRRGSKKSLSERTFIDKRPRIINARRRIGDAEADFVVSGKSGKGILLVVVDRKSRTSFLEQIVKVTISNVHGAFVLIKKRFPELMTATTDNDLLFERHKELEKLLNIKVYFCHQYHSWEKGTVENTNKVIRRDIPKGSDISRYTKRFIKRLEAKLNRRPMKVIYFQTPQETLDSYREQAKQRAKNKKRRGGASF